MHDNDIKLTSGAVILAALLLAATDSKAVEPFNYALPVNSGQCAPIDRPVPLRAWTASGRAIGTSFQTYACR